MMPSSIRVGPFDIAVIRASDEALGLVGEHKVVGDFNQGKMEIRLRDPEMFRTGAQEVEISLHEILHALYLVCGVNDRDQEEAVVSKLAIGLTGLFRDNPALIQWLSKRVNE